jgi:cytidyltransferase-like protein
MMRTAVVLASFDDMQSRQMRLLELAARIAPVHALVLSDKAAWESEGRQPRFPQEERLYVVEAVRYVDRVTLVDALLHPGLLPESFAIDGAVWVVDQSSHTPLKQDFCAAYGLQYHVVGGEDLRVFPAHASKDPAPRQSSNQRVVVTGCFDWFHSGHVRFFEEVSQLGDLYVVVGHDENVKLLKGPRHPMLPASERRYTVGSIRFVTEALISSGNGWLDAEPEIQRIKPDIYAVNEDGDRPEKYQYCQKHGIEYRVLKRLPKQGLPPRQSTDLRGF